MFAKMRNSKSFGSERKELSVESSEASDDIPKEIPLSPNSTSLLKYGYEVQLYSNQISFFLFYFIV